MTDRWMNEWMNGWNEMEWNGMEWMDRVDGRMHVWVDAWMDG